MMVCALIQISPTDGCSKGWDFFFIQRTVVSVLSCPLSVFHKEEMTRQKLKRKRLSQP